jgi:hypothetical protein
MLQEPQCTICKFNVRADNANETITKDEALNQWRQIVLMFSNTLIYTIIAHWIKRDYIVGRTYSDSNDYLSKFKGPLINTGSNISDLVYNNDGNVRGR